MKATSNQNANPWQVPLEWAVNWRGISIVWRSSSSAFGNKFLWQFPDYIGRRVVNVSPDGFTVILFGNEYFGTTIRNDDVINILFIYEKDKKSKGFTYKDIKKITLKDEIAKHDLFINGGGWISISETLTLQSVDWKNKTIHFKQVEFKF